MKILLTILLTTLTALHVFAQKTLSGRVTDASRQPLQGTIVTALNSDSVRLATTVTDSVGGFTMSFPNQDARLVVSLIGYDTRYLTVAKEYKKPLNILLKPLTNMIGEVLVKGRNIVRKNDKLVIYLPDVNKKNAYDGYSALQTLNIIGLRVNMFDESVTTHGESTTLCINGRAAGADEISTLNPADIKRIDYYQEEDLRHPGAGPVIDFIMINRDHGGTVYAKANQNVNIGKGNATVDVKQYIGKSELNAQVSGAYSRYTPDRGSESTTVMPFEDETVTKDVYTLPSPLRNNSVTGKLAFLHQWKTDKRDNMFQAAAYVKKAHSINNSVMVEEYNSDATASYDRKHRDNISPVAQLYYESNTKNSIMRAALKGSYNNIEQIRDYSSIINYNSVTNQDFYSLKPSFTYGRKIGKRHVYGISIDYEYNDIKTQYIDNAQLTNTRMKHSYGNIYLNDNYTIIPKVLKVTIQMAGSMETVDNGKENKTTFFFNPSIFYRLTLAKDHYINGRFNIGTGRPNESQYNDMEQTIDKYQRLHGNPYLKTPKFMGGLVRYSCDRKWGGFEIETEYEQQKDHVYKAVTLDNARSLYIQSYKNGNSYRKFRFTPSIVINMFDGKLSWMNGIEYIHVRDDISQVETINDLMYGTSISCNLKNFTARIDFNTPGNHVYAGIKTKSHADLNLSMAYAYRKWHFTMSARNPFYKVWSESDFRFGDYVNTSRSYSPYTRYKVFTIGANYRISYGKKHKFKTVEIDETEQSAILE